MSRAADRNEPYLSTTARAILTEFAESFPESAHYRGGRKLRKGEWQRVFPRLDTDVEEKERFLDAVEELESLGVVSVKWVRHRVRTDVDALYLEDAERLFALIGRTSPEENRAQMLDVLCGDAWSAPVDAELRGLFAAVRTHATAALEERHPLPVSAPADLRDLARLSAVTPHDARLVPLRALSVRLFGNSKRLEELLPVADRLTQRAAGVALSAELGLARAYPDASIALNGRILFDGDQRRAWTCDAEILTLPAVTIDRIRAVEFGSPTPALLSVENKETFYSLAERLQSGMLPPFDAVAYCGGHPHAAYAKLLSRCAEAGADISHFGDLDPDGLMIVAELARMLDSPVHPFLMDVATYRAYLPYAYDPPPSRIDLLSASVASLPPALRPLAAEIVAHRKGVEQEVIDTGPPTDRSRDSA
ncbi:MAG: DUF2399 domain-containing protein [Spirochaetaceae bacterium]|nr:MAG: DUF2399 domain-containing protein [Spirochaetaceae bacterium]